MAMTADRSIALDVISSDFKQLFAVLWLRRWFFKLVLLAGFY